MAGENSIRIHQTFRSPEEAIPAADALAAEGFDVQMHVVLEASATGTDEELQRLHDRVKELAPKLGLTTE